MNWKEKKNKSHFLIAGKEIKITLRILGALFLFFFLWALIFPIESAAIAHGKVALSSLSKKIQHVRGGRVVDLFVKEGDFVEKNSALLKINETKERQQRDLIAKRLNILEIVKKRLEAQVYGHNEFLQRENILENSILKDAEEYLDIEIKLLENSLEFHRSQIELLNTRVQNLIKTISELEDQVHWVDQQKQIADQEINELEDLLNRGLVGKTRLLSLKRESARLQSEKEKLQVDITSTKKERDDAQLTIQSTLDANQKEILEALQDVESKIIEEQQQLEIANTLVKENIIESPISGVIYDLIIHEVGEVVQPGQIIANVIPLKGDLAIEAYIRPIDIEMVKLGQKSNVILRPFNPRRMQSIQGIVSYISPNTIFDEKQRKEFYIAYITIEESQLESLGITPLPGMPAEIVIISDRRTLFQYIYDPIYQSFNRSFREK